jgi:hypothetical protein
MSNNYYLLLTVALAIGSILIIVISCHLFVWCASRVQSPNQPRRGLIALLVTVSFLHSHPISLRI